MPEKKVQEKSESTSSKKSNMECWWEAIQLSLKTGDFDSEHINENTQLCIDQQKKIPEPDARG